MPARVPLAACALVALVLWGATPASAQRRLGASAPADARWRVSLGLFGPAPVPDDLGYGIGPTFAVERVFQNDRERGIALGASLRVSTYTLEGGQRIRLYSPMAEFRKYTAESEGNTGLYFALGLGLTRGTNSAGGATTHFAFALGVGYDTRSPLFFDARYLRGQASGESGIAAGVGVRW
jgi:hypothetical protein